MGNVEHGAQIIFPESGRDPYKFWQYGRLSQRQFGFSSTGLPSAVYVFGQGPCTNYIALKRWGWRFRYIPLYVWLGLAHALHVTQGNYVSSLWQSEFSPCHGCRWSAIFHLHVSTCVRLNHTGVTLRQVATMLLGLLFVMVVWCYTLCLLITVSLVFTRATICQRGSLPQQRVRLSVCHEPELCQNEESHDFFIICFFPRFQFSGANFHHKILRGSLRAGASKKGGVGKFSDFLDLSVNISKTVADTAKVIIID